MRSECTRSSVRRQRPESQNGGDAAGRAGGPSPGRDEVVYAITINGEIAGVIESWVEADPDYRHAGLDIAVATRWHGTGVAVDALRTLARHLVTTEGHHRLVIDPALDNGRAIACYRKVGFQPVGVMRQYERSADGTFHDSLLMDILAEELD